MKIMKKYMKMMMEIVKMMLPVAIATEEKRVPIIYMIVDLEYFNFDGIGRKKWTYQVEEKLCRRKDDADLGFCKCSKIGSQLDEEEEGWGCSMDGGPTKLGSDGNSSVDVRLRISISTKAVQAMCRISSTRATILNSLMASTLKYGEKVNSDEGDHVNVANGE